jgi:ferredoxin-NADP reductase
MATTWFPERAVTPPANLGPLPFTRHVRSSLLARGVPAARIRYEMFGPDLWAAQAEPET